MSTALLSSSWFSFFDTQSRSTKIAGRMSRNTWISACFTSEYVPADSWSLWCWSALRKSLKELVTQQTHFSLHSMQFSCPQSHFGGQQYFLMKNQMAAGIQATTGSFSCTYSPYFACSMDGFMWSFFAAEWPRWYYYSSFGAATGASFIVWASKWASSQIKIATLALRTTNLTFRESLDLWKLSYLLSQ